MPENPRERKAADEIFCWSCGNLIKKHAEICPECGARQRHSQPLKNPGIAAVASFFVVGLGQIYNGQFFKGFMLMIAGFISALLIMALIGFILYPVIWIYAIYDAYKTAEKINAHLIT